jgi:hypothetical protein
MYRCTIIANLYIPSSGLTCFDLMIDMKKRDIPVLLIIMFYTTTTTTTTTTTSLLYD